MTDYNLDDLGKIMEAPFKSYPACSFDQIATKIPDYTIMSKLIPKPKLTKWRRFMKFFTKGKILGTIVFIASTLAGGYVYNSTGSPTAAKATKQVTQEALSEIVERITDTPIDSVSDPISDIVRGTIHDDNYAEREAKKLEEEVG